MAKITPLIQQYEVDFASNNNFLFIKGVQYDGYETRYADISLMNNGQPYEIDSDVVCVAIRGSKPDNSSIYNECEIIDENTIRVEITQQMAMVAGKSDYEISIISLLENKTLTSFPFYIVISSSSFSPLPAVSSNEYSLLVNKINKVTELTTKTDNLIAENEEMMIKHKATIQESKDATSDSRVATAENILATNSLKTYHAEVIEAENSRVEAENLRVQAEVSRVEVETARVEAENTRNDNEDIRKENENTRQSNEKIRQDNENTRQSQEKARQQQASDFKDAEDIRVQSENTRISNENERKSNESSRVEAENARIEVENTRVTSENARISNENERKSNEETRQAQETARQTNTATAISNANAAATNANNAVELLKNSVGINDNPTEEEASVVAYSAKKVQSFFEKWEITLPLSGWSETAPYTQTIDVGGMKKDYSPIVSLNMANVGTESEKKQIQKSWNYVDLIMTGNGTIVATCNFNKPIIDIPIVIKGV